MSLLSQILIANTVITSHQLKNVKLRVEMPILRKPKTLAWTAHSRAKMRYYGFSEARVKRIIHSPKRTEEGIAPKTVAMMQSAGSEKHPYELWVMIQDVGQKRKVISAWRYPGQTKPNQPLPTEILNEIKAAL